MGYSRSKRTIERVRTVLDLVLARIDRNEVIAIPTKNPQKLSYAIRDGLAVVKSLPESAVDRQYSVIPDKYKLRIKSDRIVFEPRETLDFADPITELAKSRTHEVNIPDVVTLIEVVGAAVQHKGETMAFPHAKISNDDLERLSRWATLNHYRITQMEPLTLSRHGPHHNTQNSNLDKGQL